MLSRREALLGVLLAPLVKPVVAMLPRVTDPRPWKPKWKERFLQVLGPPMQTGETIMIDGEVWWVMSMAPPRPGCADYALIRARNA